MFEIDFEGAISWGWHPFNATPFRLRVELGSCFRKHLSQMTGLMMALIMLVIRDSAWIMVSYRRYSSAHPYAWHALVAAWSPLWRGLAVPTLDEDMRGS